MYYTHGLFLTCTQKSHLTCILVFTQCTSNFPLKSPCLNKESSLYILGGPASCSWWRIPIHPGPQSDNNCPTPWLLLLSHPTVHITLFPILWKAALTRCCPTRMASSASATSSWAMAARVRSWLSIRTLPSDNRLPFATFKSRQRSLRSLVTKMSRQKKYVMVYWPSQGQQAEFIALKLIKFISS